MRYSIIKQWRYTTSDEDFRSFVKEFNLEIEFHNNFGVTLDEYPESDIDENEAFPLLLDDAEKYLCKNEGYAYQSYIDEDGIDIIWDIYQIAEA